MLRTTATGMSPDDARLSLQRHATSKLGSASDLERIASFGFRGEALPSIASVSRFRLVTRLKDASEACEIRAAGGTVEEPRSLGAPFGTHIEVADLFAQVPARRKFLKKPSTEWGHIADWLARLALVLPAVHFEIRRDDRAPQIWPATQNVLDRIAAVLSEEEASALIAATGTTPAGELRAFISAPDWTRPNTNSIHLFVNGRPVRTGLFVMRCSNPTGTCFLEVASQAPWLYLSVEPEVGGRQCAPSEVGGSVLGPTSHSPTGPPNRQSRHGRKGLAGPASGRQWRTRQLRDRSGWRTRRLSNREAHGINPSRWPTRCSDFLPSERASLRVLGRRARRPRPLWAIRSRSRVLATRSCSGSCWRATCSWRAPTALVLVDQHAAHERVLYERLRSQWLVNGVEMQALLISENIDLDIRGAAVLADSGRNCSAPGL